MNGLKNVFCFALILFALSSYGQSKRLAVVTWNVENLFDTAHDYGKQDEEFLPSATRKWNSGRYWHKLKNITQTLAAMDLPDLVAMEEVENDTVLRDLTRRTALRNAHYRYVITDSPDQRGVDVALLYKPSVFQLLNWHAVRVPSEKYGLRATRDILYASGNVGTDTLHICVVHLPSRQNNNAATRHNRMLAVETMLNIIDSINGQKHLGTLKPSENQKPSETQKPNIVILGDFNAEPGDEIFKKLCPPMISLLPADKKELRRERGTYYFRGVWGFLDHILVSQPLKKLASGEAQECRFTFLLRTNRHFPWRTYGGTSYLGGISDHLPLKAEFIFPTSQDYRHEP